MGRAAPKESRHPKGSRLFAFVHHLEGGDPKAERQRREATLSGTWNQDMRLATLKPRVQTLKASRVQQIEGTKRISGNSLYAIMKRFERMHPRICAECRRQGLVGFGDELDHIVPLHLGGKESDANRQWLCREHHAEKTAREAGGRARMLTR